MNEPLESYNQMDTAGDAGYTHSSDWPEKLPLLLGFHITEIMVFGGPEQSCIFK